MSVRRHRLGRGQRRGHLRAEAELRASAPPSRREALRRVLAAALMALLALPLLFWLFWPLGFLFRVNPIMLAGLVAGPGVIILAVLWAWRASSARQTLRRALLTMAIVGLLLPLNGLPFLISEIRLAQGSGGRLSALASSTAVAMALWLTVEDAVAGIVVAALALVVRWALRPKGERGLRRKGVEKRII